MHGVSARVKEEEDPESQQVSRQTEQKDERVEHRQREPQVLLLQRTREVAGAIGEAVSRPDGAHCVWLCISLLAIGVKFASALGGETTSQTCFKRSVYFQNKHLLIQNIHI